MIALALLLPWLLLPLALAGPRLMQAALVLAPLPLLATALLPPDTLDAPALLLGGAFSSDAALAPLRLLGGLGWLLAGLFAARWAGTDRRLALFWLATLGGQALALLAGNIADFYLGYVTMTLAAFGLVVHAGTTAAWRAGRIYLLLAFAGEALILAGLLLLGARYGNAALDSLPGQLMADGAGAAGPLLLVGFAVKLGIVPLHAWLPLAHPVAPVPASAILSGVIVKAGLLGWLRFIPPEPVSGLPLGLLAGLGLFTAFFAVAAGLCQQKLKTVLAYSTISQMGLLLAAVTASFLTGGGTVLALLFALHHGLNKIALFLAAGCAVGASRLRALMFALPALALAGLPLTSGAWVKEALKDALGASGLAGLALPFALSSTGTLLLMLHAFRLARRDRDVGARLNPAWPMAVLLALLLPSLWLGQAGLAPMPGPGKLIDALWPLLLAVLLWVAWRRLPGGYRRRQIHVPEGDIVVWLEYLGRRIAGLWRQEWALRKPEPDPASLRRLSQRIRRVEIMLLRLPIVGGAMLLIMLLLWVLALQPG
ncbi:MAG: NADH/ubiquinone/plastoquinone (complex I) [Chromatiales bacterium]|nr:NADH/ubiquinone/plastoquinone (complex I) [Chromatiales bacterium]